MQMAGNDGARVIIRRTVSQPPCVLVCGKHLHKTVEERDRKKKKKRVRTKNSRFVNSRFVRFVSMSTITTTTITSYACVYWPSHRTRRYYISLSAKTRIFFFFLRIRTSIFIDRCCFLRVKCPEEAIKAVSRRFSRRTERKTWTVFSGDHYGFRLGSVAR